MEGLLYEAESVRGFVGLSLAEKLKASVRAKNLSSNAIGGGTPLPEGEAGVRYRGLAKNTERLARLFGLGNLLTAESRLTG